MSDRNMGFRQEFIKHLEALSSAIDHTQPLAEYAGNFHALHALVALKTAAEAVLIDIKHLLDNEEEVK